MKLEQLKQFSELEQKDQLIILFTLIYMIGWTLHNMYGKTKDWDKILKKIMPK